MRRLPARVDRSFACASASCRASPDRLRRSPLLSFCFPSVLAGHAALSCAAMRPKTIPPRRSKPPRESFAARAVFRFASATRICLRSRSLAAQSDDLLSIRLRRRRESCIAAFLLIGDVPLLAVSALRDLVDLDSPDFRDRVIDFPAGLVLLLQALATADEAAARHQTRVRAGLFESTALMGFFPSQVLSRRRVRCCLQPRGPACCSSITRRDLFSSRNRPSEGKSQVRKRTGDYELSVQLPGFTPAIDPTRGDFSRRKSILPWVLPLAGFRADLSPQRRGHDPATIISLRPRDSATSTREAYPLMGLTAHLDDAESQTKCFATRIPDSSLRCRAAEFTVRDVAGPYSVLGG